MAKRKGRRKYKICMIPGCTERVAAIGNSRYCSGELDHSGRMKRLTRDDGTMSVETARNMISWQDRHGYVPGVGFDDPTIAGPDIPPTHDILTAEKIIAAWQRG